MLLPLALPVAVCIRRPVSCDRQTVHADQIATGEKVVVAQHSIPGNSGLALIAGYDVSEAFRHEPSPYLGAF